MQMPGWRVPHPPTVRWWQTTLAPQAVTFSTAIMPCPQTTGQAMTVHRQNSALAAVTAQQRPPVASTWTADRKKQYGAEQIQSFSIFLLFTPTLIPGAVLCKTEAARSFFGYWKSLFWLSIFVWFSFLNAEIVDILNMLQSGLNPVKFSSECHDSHCQ